MADVLKIRGKLPRLRVRMGVLPTRIEKDRTRYTRKIKHRNRDRDGSVKPVVFPSRSADFRLISQASPFLAE